MDNDNNLQPDYQKSLYPYQQPAFVISVFSLRGGIGKTTLAVNLSTALAKIWRAKIGLIDMAFETGHCSLMLDLKPKATMAVLSDWPEPIDDDVINQILVEHPSGVMLLAGADSPSEGELITPELFDLVFPYITKRFPIVVADAGSSLTEISLSLLDRSDLILLVFSPELASVKSTSDALGLFNEFGYPPGKVQPVANWVFPSNPLLLNRITQTLKVGVLGEIPYDGNGFIQAVNTGQPPVINTPTSPASEAIYRLAYQISHEEMIALGHKSDPAVIKI